MKRTLGILAVLFLILGIAGSVWLRQREKEREAQQQAVALQSQVQALETELVQRQAEAERKVVETPVPTCLRSDPCASES